MIYIRDIKDKENTQIELKGWVFNKRLAKDLLFLILRDGTGFLQCVVQAKDVGETHFSHIKSIGQESAVTVQGKIIKDERQEGGFELHVNQIDILHNSIVLSHI